MSFAYYINHILLASIVYFNTLLVLSITIKSVESVSVPSIPTSVPLDLTTPQDYNASIDAFSSLATIIPSIFIVLTLNKKVIDYKLFLILDDCLTFGLFGALPAILILVNGASIIYIIMPSVGVGFLITSMYIHYCMDCGEPRRCCINFFYIISISLCASACLVILMAKQLIRVPDLKNFTPTNCTDLLDDYPIPYMLFTSVLFMGAILSLSLIVGWFISNSVYVTKITMGLASIVISRIIWYLQQLTDQKNDGKVPVPVYFSMFIFKFKESDSSKGSPNATEPGSSSQNRASS
ncbi:11487_t:CDS:2 [Ambispora gerdemannii]|uniref:11487_t:CDS:1 n=1 Tax=Ambispora gerdemannii TaxID=144530 RepID=A0A9N8W5F5_9GLOM|nr:11487_t:CDS:2 [Ambispora gerdemannii]